MADRATGVAADGERCESGCDGGCGSAAGSAGDAIGSPGSAGGAEGRVFGRRAHGEFVHVRLADQDAVGFAESLDAICVVGREPAVEHPAGTGGGLIGCDQQVLESDGESGEWSEWLAGRASPIDRLGHLTRLIASDMQEGSDRLVVRRDGRQAGLGQCQGRCSARGELIEEFRGGFVAGGHGWVVMRVPGESLGGGVEHRRHEEEVVVVSRGTRECLSAGQ